MSHYDHRKIEAKWQKFWEQNKTFCAHDDSKKQKYYVLDMFPYPSSAGLHVGHPLGYTATDIVSRFLRMKGYNVLHPMGWDAFGLPAENYAIKTKIHPEQSTTDSIKTFKRQIQELGFSYDWDREIRTCSAEYYKWTQWFFAFLYKNNLAYRKKAPVNWCDDCHTVLANEQVIEGRCERCKNEVIQKSLEQWFFRITDFIEDNGKTSGLLSGLEKIDWPNSTKISQRNWIGKSKGCNVFWKIDGKDIVLKTFTTTVDTIYGVTFAIISPEHPELIHLTSKDHKKEVQDYIEKSQKKTERERMDEGKEKTGVFTGAHLIHPFTEKKIPLLVADYVLMSYGTGVVMGVPAHDQRDMDFAKKYNLPIIQVIRDKNGETFVYDRVDKYRVEGTIFDSDKFSDLDILDGRNKITEALEKKKLGEWKIEYKLRDWLVSRQRYWGSPIPIVYDDQGKDYLLPEDELPVHLPHDVDFVPHGESPLAKSKSYHDAKDLKRIEEKLHASGSLPKDRKIVKREADTMDTFVCSSWYMFRFMDPKNDKEFASKKMMKKWGPIDLYVGGAEHTVLHLLYARFFTKALRKYGYIDYDEPFAKLRHQGMILGEDGQKMSKSIGNVINPDEIIETHGADTLRCYEMFMGPFDQRKPWSQSSVQGIKRFLDRVWREYYLFKYVRLDPETSNPKLEKDKKRALHKTVKKVTEDIENFKFNTAIAQLMGFLNQNGLRREKSDDSTLSRAIFCKLLSPFAPHIAEELWSEVLEHKDTIVYEPWPEYDEKYLEEDMVTYAVQVNGKVRGDFEIAKDAEKEEVIVAAKKLPKVQSHLEGKQIVKEVFVPEKIVGFVVK